MSINEKMTAIADKIRTLLGLLGSMGLDDMAAHLGTEQANITAALAAIADKGVNVPEGSNSNDLATLIASIAAGSGASWVTIAETLPNAMYQLGDVLMDGSVTIDDAIEVANNPENLTPVQKTLADVDSNGVVSYIDAMTIMDMENGNYTPPLKFATAVEYAAAKAGDDVKAIFEIKVNGNKMNAPTYACVPWDGIIAIYSGVMIPAGTTGLIQILQ